MTTENEVFKLEKDLCRCCHADGNFISLNEMYHNENFRDVIKNCFDMNIAPVSGHLNDITYTICPDCVQKLQDAYSFKNRVRQCENRFYEFYYRDAIFKEAHTNSAFKVEPDIQTAELGKADDPSDALSKDDNSEDDVNLSELKLAKRIARIKKSKKRIKDETQTMDNVSKTDYRTDIRTTVKLILMFSDATLFRWSYSKYMCFFCDQAFQKFAELKQHSHDHDVQLEHPLLSVKAETKIKIEISDLTCKVCPKEMQSVDDLLDHITTTHDKKLNGAVRRSMLAFRITDGDVPCPQCSERFTFFGTLLSHVYRTHVSAGQFLCDACGRGFLTKPTLRKHVRAEHLVADYLCQKCNLTFKTYGAFSYHRIVHKGVFDCPQCSESFPSWYLRKRHLAFVHDASLQISCQFCSKKFIKYNSLKWHLMSVHQNEKPFSCDMCDFKCINRTYLNRHMVCHSDVRPFQCHVCVKAFQRKEHLDSHVRIHTNDRRYVCKDCGKGFVQVAGLRVHARAHHSKDA